ncbi:hypothetical protein SERAS_46730 (plasmid) [Serratia marcescens]|nr:hypothetical protein SERAS_46730 [Serratia marcescens]
MATYGAGFTLTSFYGHSGTYTLDAEAALPALVGHPAVFWQDAPDVRIDIEPGQVTLVITEAGEHLALTLRPSGISDSRGLLWEKETPTRLVVYPVSDEHRKIAGILGRELRIPAGARDRVLQSVSSIAPLLPVQANLPELTAHIPHVPPDEKLYAHLLPLGEGLRLQLRVHPLPSGTAFPPGRGGDIVNGEHDGQAIQTRRDLPAEQQRLQQVLAACPILDVSATDTTEWQLTDTQDALEALTQLRAVDPAQLECVWPEGERLRLGGRRDMQALKLFGFGMAGFGAANIVPVLFSLAGTQTMMPSSHAIALTSTFGYLGNGITAFRYLTNGFFLKFRCKSWCAHTLLLCSNYRAGSSTGVGSVHSRKPGAVQEPPNSR